MVILRMMPDYSRFCFASSFFLIASVSWLSSYIFAAVASVIATWTLVMVAPARGWVVVPRQNRWNKRVVAQFGGVPVLLVFLAFGLWRSHSFASVLLLLLTLGMGILGLVDDIVGLGPKPKLTVELILAGFAVYGGVLLPLTPYIFANRILTVLWIIGITNAFNLIDNMDGLAAGVGLISLTSMFMLTGQPGSSELVLFMLAALAGFFLFNVNPARIFMGDVGALSIGFFLACSSALMVSPAARPGAAFSAGLLLFVPIFDVLLVMFTRVRNGRPIYDGARDHSSHRLVFLGLSERGAVAVLYGIAAAAGGLAISGNRLPPLWQTGLVIFFTVAALLFWIYLACIDLPADWLSRPRAGRAAVAPIVLPRKSEEFGPAQSIPPNFAPTNKRPPISRRP